MTAEERLRQALAGVMPEAHADELIAELRREIIASYGSLVTSFPPLPDDSRLYERQKAWQRQLQAGVTPFAWAVGYVACPSENCTAGPLSVFVPYKGGKVPMHRSELGRRVCDGVGARPGLLRLAEEAQDA